MFRNRFAALALAIGSLSAFAAPSTALAHDRRDDRWERGRQEHRLSAREQRLYEQQRVARERYLREQELQREQRYTAPYGYNPQYGYQARDGYYDRYGQWHSYSYRY